MRVPWTARISNQSIQKEINPEYSLEGLMLKLKLQYLGYSMQRTDSSEKTLMLGKIEGRRRRGRQRMRWLYGITYVMDVSLSRLCGYVDKYDLISYLQGASVQFSSVAQLCLTLCDPTDCSTPDFPIHHQLLELTQLMSTDLVMPSNHLLLCHPLLFLPSIFTSIRVFSNELILHIRWSKYWSFSFIIRPSKE